MHCVGLAFSLPLTEYLFGEELCWRWPDMVSDLEVGAVVLGVSLL